MDIIERLDAIEEKYAETLDETRETAIAEIIELHSEIMESAPDEIDRFTVLSADVLGGVYLPYLFWYKLGEFYDGYEDARIFLQELIKIFSESNFEEEEQRKMKSLLVAYFAKEKEFEIDKLRVMVVDKAHHTVKEYFNKLLQFAQKNQKATQMYCDKFEILKEYQPDFQLLQKPLTKLQELL
ncbi:MAG: hypothetical protein K1X92_13605 [Bacteroidia bacterium]|nr:hypothetical protein [Bacteroidia bacterium]